MRELNKCPVCGRYELGRGQGALIEGARAKRPQPSTPSVDFLRTLHKKRRTPTTVKRLADIQVRLEQCSRQGLSSLRQPDDYRPLRGDIWELKAGDVRLPFFRVRASDGPTCHPEVLRVTHIFLKTTGKTSRGHKDNADRIRKEDLDGDRT